MKQPMKGVKVTDEDLKKLRFPLYASIKWDGIRAVVKDCIVLSVSMKPIPNKYIQKMLGRKEFEGLDGELTVEGEFNEQSPIMTVEGEPDFTYRVFDRWDFPDVPYVDRLHSLGDSSYHHRYPYIIVVEQVLYNNLEELQNFENKTLAEGHEGIMPRSINGLYKYGKSTLREQYLLKRKPMEDAEAIIKGFIEAMENTNEATISETGRTKRSSHKAGKTNGKGMIGTILAWSAEFGNIEIGPGEANHDLRKRMHEHPEDYIGQIAQYTFQRKGTLNKPRSPIFRRLRHPDDMTK